MALVLADRVKETTTTTGQGTITLAGAATGFQSFSAIGNSNTTYYTIAGQGTSEWEVGIGTYTASGTTLSRDTVLASSAGGTTKTTFSAGTKDVFVTYPAGKSVYEDGANDVTLPGNLAVTGSITQGGNPVVPQVQTQTLSSGSGSWSKPTTGGYQFVQIEIWAGGGSGAKSNVTTNGATGGGGGAYNTITVPLSYLAASEAYTVGAGGNAVTAAGAGNTGGFSSFAITNYPGGAETLFAYGGGPGSFISGNNAGGGGGGGISSAGLVSPSSSVGGAGGTWPGFGGQGGSGSTPGGDSIYGGAGGGGGTITTGNAGGTSYYGGGGSSNVPGSGGSNALTSGSSVWGGGAGGSTAGSTGLPGAGGTSKFGGAGGAAVHTTTAVSGSVPAGGGGATRTGTASGAGAAGQIRLTWW
jgi:hypothetical protein